MLLCRAIYRQPGGAPALAAHPHPDDDADLYTHFDRQPHPLADCHAHPFQYAEDAYRDRDQDLYPHADAHRHANIYPVALTNRNPNALGDLYQHARAAYLHKHPGATHFHKYARAAYFHQHARDPIGDARSAYRYPQSFRDVAHADRPV
jgi:hypothetical protein